MFANNQDRRHDNANYTANKRVHNDPVDKYHHNEYFMEKLFMSFALLSLSWIGIIPPSTHRTLCELVLCLGKRTPMSSAKPSTLSPSLFLSTVAMSR